MNFVNLTLQVKEVKAEEACLVILFRVAKLSNLQRRHSMDGWLLVVLVGAIRCRALESTFRCHSQP